MNKALLLGVVTFFSAIEAADAAELTLQARWEPFSVAGLANQLFGDNGFGVGGKFGNFVLRGNLGLQWISVGSSFEDDGFDASYSSDSTESGLIITPSLSAQYFLRPPTPGALAPFVSARVGKAFASLSSEETWCSDGDCETSDPDADAYAESVLSPWMAAVGGGLEYFVNDSLSIGTELGLRYFRTAAEEDEGDSKQNQSIGIINLAYGAVTLNMYW